MELHWIDRTLAVSTRPEGGPLLKADLEDARRAGLEILVSCLQPSEERELSLVREEAEASAAGIHFLRFRMTDGGTPYNDDAFDDLVEELAAEVSAGRRVVIHCRAGVGRSPLMAAAVLVRQGASAAEAWGRVGNARGHPVPDNDEQRQYLSRFEARLRRQEQRQRQPEP